MNGREKLELCGELPDAGCCWYNDDSISWTRAHQCNTFKTNVRQCIHHGGISFEDEGYIREYCMSGVRIYCCHYPEWH